MEEQVTGEFTPFEHRVTGILYLITGSLGTYLNLMSLMIFFRHKPLSGTRNLLHVSLNLANIMIVLGTPFSGLSAFSGRWLFGDLGCRLYGLETYIGGMGAVTFACILCVERFLSNVWKQSCDSTLVALGWLVSVAVSLGPFLGWNSYVIEESGTACGLNWRDDDQSFFKALLWINTLLFVIALAAIWATFTHEEAETEAKVTKDEWFTERQLNWVAIANFAIANLGFTPYGIFAIWSVFSERESMTMLASVIPPLAAKLSTIFYPLVYLVACKRFRMAYGSKAFGLSADKKTQ